MMMYDVASLNLTLRSQKTNTVPAWLGRATQAFYLRSMEQINAGLSAAVHDSSRPKPFTASNLNGGDVQARMQHFRPYQQVNLRYTTLHPHLTALMLNGLLPGWLQNGINIHDQIFCIESVAIESGEHPAAGLTTYAALIDEAECRDETITLEFASPTAFKRTDGRYDMLPLPELVFGSLLIRWNMFAPVCMPDEMAEIIRTQVNILAYDIRTTTVRWHDRREPIPAFTGTVTYEIGAANRVAQRYLHVLAAFALYSGVGLKTTTGFGQARARLQ